ncbi:MAG: hypothetical protein LBH44_11480 [Treponema sp.]|jgi:hypothetical protein|nr:hypothetical protein [Treponema sp.]
MRKILLLVILSLLCVSCKAKGKDGNAVIENNAGLEQENGGYTFEEFRAEFKESFSVFDIPIGTYFWEEFKEFEAQYALPHNESRLLGVWMNATWGMQIASSSYSFFPNNLFILSYGLVRIQIDSADETYFDKAVGIWEVVNGMVCITIYAIVTDRTKDWRINKGMFFVERPYTVDFIRIDDIGEEGFTKRPINDTILSEELQRMVTIKEPNRTNNLYVRNVYSIIHNPGNVNKWKDYGYFEIVPDLARENLTGLDVATNPELIEKYIFGL